MNNNIFIALTHYHIIYSIIYAQQIEGKSSIYIINDYLSIDEGIKEKLEKLKIFEKVVICYEMPLRDKIFNELPTKDSSKLEYLFNDCFENYFSSIIEISDENIYLFNQKTLIYNFLYKKTDKITIIEDGYQTIQQQQNVHVFRGRLKLLEPYIGKEFAPLNYSSSGIKNIFGSKSLKDSANIDFADKYIQNDFKEMIKVNREKYIEQINQVYPQPNLEGNKIGLLITQPLSRVEYCYKMEQYLLYRKIVRENFEDCDKVYIKLHPADDKMYKNFIDTRVEVIEDDFPVDILSLGNDFFEEIVTFGSSSLKLFDNVNIKKEIYKKENFKYDDVVTFIRNYIEDEKVEVAILNSNDLDFNKLNKRNTIFNYSENLETADLILFNDNNAKYDLDTIKSIENKIKDKYSDISCFGLNLINEGKNYAIGSKYNGIYIDNIYGNKIVSRSIYDKFKEQNLSLSQTIYDEYIVTYYDSVGVNYDASSFSLDIIKEEMLNGLTFCDTIPDVVLRKEIVDRVILHSIVMQESYNKIYDIDSKITDYQKLSDDAMHLLIKENLAAQKKSTLSARRSKSERIKSYEKRNKESERRSFYKFA
ncbi:MAG: glycosyltransferase family 52, partial [Erysipelotrichales bacterium]